MSKFSEKFKELRKSRSLSQQELADYLHTSKSSVNMYERGEREPGLEMLEAIADYFNVDMDYLVGKADIANKALSNPPVPLLTDREITVALAYRNHPAEQTAVDRILEIDWNEYETVRVASRSADDDPITDIKVPKSKIKAALADKSIKTDDDL